MATIPYSFNILYSQPGPLDSKDTPRGTKSLLNTISINSRYEGMMVYITGENKFYIYSKDADNNLTWLPFENICIMFVGNWKVNINYYTNINGICHMVEHDGCLYKCILDNINKSPELNPSEWEKIGEYTPSLIDGGTFI